MKYIFFYLLVVCGLFFSCDKKEFTDMSVSSDVSTSTEENRAIAKSSQAYLFAQKQLGIAPSGWTNVKNGKAVALYKRDQGSTVYVTELDLSRGAVLTSYYQYKDKNISAATQKTPSPSFVANPVSKFSDKMTKYGWFMVCNLNFFGNGYQSAHILKKGGTIVTCGYAGYKEKSFSKRYLNILVRILQLSVILICINLLRHSILLIMLWEDCILWNQTVNIIIQVLLGLINGQKPILEGQWLE